MAIVQIRNIHPSQAASLGSAETSNGLRLSQPIKTGSV